jgi:endonuclease/exonuclease/phosphatase family metal-dependent hydrolase
MTRVWRVVKTYVLLLIVAIFIVVPVHAETIRVATCNIYWNNRQPTSVLKAVEAASPDLVCFQETTPERERLLQLRLKNTYPHFYSSGHKGDFVEERFAFASKYELNSIKFMPPGAGLFGFYTGKIKLAETEVQVVNVHLSPFRPKPNARLRELMAEMSATEATHALEIDAILGTVDSTKPTVIVGDFNSISTFAAPKKLRAVGFIDAFSSVTDDADAHATWQWPSRPLPLSLRIDFIFHSSHFTTVNSKVVQVPGSDHSLVVAELRLKD